MAFQEREISPNASMGAKAFNWFDSRFPSALGFYKAHMSEYYAPKNFNFWYFFGSLSLLVLVIQIVTGIFLVMHYKPDAALAFGSVEYIMRDVPWGWLIRYMHSTGASAFFIVVYLHMYRGLIYGSYRKPRELVWIFGCAIFLSLMGEAFFGYLLPWGQMSYWGAQVIVNLFSAIPFVGPDLALMIRGDYVVSDATLNRFFSFHVIAIPLVLLGLVAAHILALHDVGSNNPDGVEIKGPKALKDAQGHPVDGIPFHPYYSVHDILGVSVFLMVFTAIIFFAPEVGGYFLEYNNFIPADSLKTPPHIAPVWYFTPFYSMLRATTDVMVDVFCVIAALAAVAAVLKGRMSAFGKIAVVVAAAVAILLLKTFDAKFWGVVVMGGAVIILFFLPWLDYSPAKSIRYRPGWHKWVYGVFVVFFIVLGYLGIQPPSDLGTLIAQTGTIYYFGFFLLMPWWSRMGTFKPVPDRIVFWAIERRGETNMKKILLTLIAAFGLMAGAQASEESLSWDKAPNKTNDLPSLQNGAKLFVNYCLNCHSAAFMRYNRLRDIGLSEQQIKDNMLFATEKVGDTMKSAIDPKDAKDWFGANPPDLTLIARSRSGHGGTGADYIYTYLRTYYRDPTKATGWNNLAFPNVAMPHALWELQGVREPVFETAEEHGHEVKVFKGWKQVTPGTMTPLQYDNAVADLVGYLQWMAEPAQNSRIRVGVWVLIFLAVFTFFAWRLNAAFWKNIK